MTDCTPTQARELSERLDDLDLTGGREGAHALRSLANQVEALTAENANILRASLYSADIATQAMEDVKTLTADRDALKADAARLDFLQSQGSFVMGWTCRHSTTGRGYRLHQTADSSSATPRLAIDAAMKDQK